VVPLTHLGAAHRRAGFNQRAAAVVGDHRLGRLGLTHLGELTGAAGDPGVERVTERTDLRHRTGEVAESYPITPLRDGVGQLSGQCDDPGAVHTTTLPNGCVAYLLGCSIRYMLWAGHRSR
jgi:hypothetical protein